MKQHLDVMQIAAIIADPEARKRTIISLGQRPQDRPASNTEGLFVELREINKTRGAADIAISANCG